MQSTWSVALLAVLFILTSTTGLHASPGSGQHTLPPSELRKFERRPYTPPEIVQIQAAEAKKDFKLARQLEDALINRPDNSFETVWRGHWIKALALKARFQDRQALGEPHKQVLGDLLASARLGNLEAIRQAEDILEEYLIGMNQDEYPPLTDEDIMSVYKAGAELADPPSAISYGTGRTQLFHAKLPGDMPQVERVFWIVLGFVSNNEASRDQRKKVIDQAVHEFGVDALTQGLLLYGVAGGVIKSSVSGVPGRDVYSAFAAESNLRAEYSISYNGTGMPPPNTPNPEMSARELFDDETIMIESAGLGRLYLFASSITSGDMTYTATLSRGEMLSNILPDDTIIVRCGPISHVAIVYHVNLTQDKIYLTDPLYGYWQPSHNACMSKYSLIEGPVNGYLVVVSAKEVQATLQGVITLRTDLSTK